MNAKKSALIVIDMQNIFFNVNDFPENMKEVGQKQLEDTIEAAKKTVRWARKNEIPIIWTYEIQKTINVPDKENLEQNKDQLAQNSQNTRLIDDMEPFIHSEDSHIRNKRRWDAFYGTDLEIILRGMNTEKVYLIGSAAAACVLSTALSAKMRDYQVVLVKDAIWGIPEKIKAMEVISESFSEITVSESLL